MYMKSIRPKGTVRHFLQNSFLYEVATGLSPEFLIMRGLLPKILYAITRLQSWTRKSPLSLNTQKRCVSLVSNGRSVDKSIGYTPVAHNNQEMSVYWVPNIIEIGQDL